MISETNPRWAFPGAVFALIVLTLALRTAPVHGEDPLLGRIKLIKCVGCDPGAVNLVVHDPIDVRDFEVQIKESDYQKIITPLAGKTVYDKEGCFYWMERPKHAKPAAGMDSVKKAVKKSPLKEAASMPDSTRMDAGDAMAETSAFPALSAAQEPQGTPSRCIPYIRLQPKPAPGGKKDEE